MFFFNQSNEHGMIILERLYAHFAALHSCINSPKHYHPVISNVKISSESMYDHWCNIVNINEIVCPKCGGSDVREKLLAVDCPEAHWDGIEREGQFWPPGKLWSQPGFKNREELSGYIVDTPNGTFLKAQYCNNCEAGFIPDKMLAVLKWDGKKNIY